MEYYRDEEGRLQLEVLHSDEDDYTWKYQGRGTVTLGSIKKMRKANYLEELREGENGNIKQKGTLLFLYYADEFMSFCSCLVSSIVGIWGGKVLYYILFYFSDNLFI